MHFRLNALREKLFKDEKKPPEEEDCGRRKMRKKRYIRSLLAEEIEKKSREELQVYLNSPGHRPDQNLLKIARNSNFAISRRNISKIVYSLEKRETPNPYLHRQKPEEDERDPFLLRMTRLNAEIKTELREKLRRTGEFLVESHEGSVMKATHRKGEGGGERGREEGGFREMSWTPVTVNADVVGRRRRDGKGKEKAPSKVEAELIRLVCSGDLTSV